MGIYFARSAYVFILTVFMRVILYPLNPYPADHNYCRFQSVLLVGQITDIGNEMCA